MDFKEWLNRKDIIEEDDAGKTENSNQQNQEGEGEVDFKSTDIEIIKCSNIINDIYTNIEKLKNTIAVDNVETVNGVLKDVKIKDGNESDISAKDIELYFCNNYFKKRYEEHTNIIPFVFYIAYLKTTYPDIFFKSSGGKAAIKSDCVGFSAPQDLTKKINIINNTANFRKSIQKIDPIQIDNTLKTYIGTNDQETYGKIVKLFNSIYEGALPEELKDKVETENKDDKTKPDGTSEAGSASGGTSASGGVPASGETKPDGTSEAGSALNGASSPNEEELKRIAAQDKEFAGTKEWGIEKVKAESITDSYTRTVEQYGIKAEEKFKEILSYLEGRKNDAISKEEKKAKLADNNAYDEINNGLNEAIDIAKKINPSIINEFRLFPQSKKTADTNLTSGKTEKNVRDLFDTKLKAILEKYINKAKKICPVYEKAGVGFEGARAALVTFFVELEFELNKLLRDMKKKAGPTYTQRRAEHKQAMKDWEQKLLNTDEKYVTKQAVKAERQEVQKKIDETKKDIEAKKISDKIYKLLSNPGDDVSRLFSYSFVNALKYTRDREALKNIFSKKFEFYNTTSNDFKNSVVDYTSMNNASMITFERAFDKYTGYNSMAFIEDLIANNTAILDTLRKQLSTRIGDFEASYRIYSNASTEIGKQIIAAKRTNGNVYIIPKTITVSGKTVELNGTGAEDVAFRQFLATGKYYTKLANNSIYIGKNKIEVENAIKAQTPTATVTTAAADGLPTGYQKRKLSKVMRRKLGM